MVAATVVSCAESPREDEDLAPSQTNPTTDPTTSANSTTTDPTLGTETGDKLDVDEDTETGPTPPIGVEFSYIWLANSDPGTVSKIDTQTGDEVARFETGPADQAEPSRTSVNLLGDVAVANRGSEIGGFGGVSKIVTREEGCEDRNANGAIDTSNGPGNVLDWGEDECVVWNLLIPSDVFEHGPRPTVWEGTLTEDGDPEPNPRLWVGWYAFERNLARIHRLDGATGQIQDTVDIPWNELDYGPYGGAVNRDGDFWVLGWKLGPLIRIDSETLEVERIELPAQPGKDPMLSYGMALDQLGNP